jgi:competence protein ComEC
MIILVGWLCLLLAFILIRRRTKIQSLLFGLWIFFLCLALGTCLGFYSRPTDPGLPVEDLVVIRGIVKEAPEFTHSLLRCEVSLKLLFANDTVYPCKTELQVYFYPGTDSIFPRPGESWLWLGELKPIRNSGNPGTPDFETILQKKNCWYRFFASSMVLPRYSVRTTEESFRPGNLSYMRFAYFDSWQAGEEELALLKAVCLGDRSALTEKMQNNYGAAGGMHLLAVSGLHVGLIWWVLQGATRWMVRRAKTEILRTVLVLSLLWFYASVTGFSSSVCRSVTMFSFLSAGRLSGQRTQSLNVILSSAFLLLLIQPSRLMELGFQLSYSAILGIVVFFPLFQGLFRIKNPILRWLWNAASVSFAAQLLAAPLVIYHFHYLPVYSILSSILAIPLLSLLIALFTASVPFIMSGLLEHVFFELMGRLAWLMNFTMETVSALPGAVIKDLHLSLPVLCLWMFFLGLGMCFLLSRSRLPVFLMVMVFSLMVIFSSWTLVNRRETSELVLCHFRGGSQIILREGREVDIYSWGGDSISQVYMHRYRSEVWSLRIYQVNYTEAVPGHGICGSISSCLELARGIWAVGNEKLHFWVLRGPSMDTRAALMLLDSAGINIPRPHFILLSGEPGHFHPRSLADGAAVELIMDGSNRSWFREEMHKFSAGIYDTERQGAYIKRW